MTGLIESFRNAFAGLAQVVRSQRNARIHLVLTIAVAVLGMWLRLAPLEWAVLLLAVGLVWTAELFNTALEAAVDLASPERRPLARTAKDVGAAAVLASALTAAVLGALILGSRIVARLG